jgi:hypothetical protein
MIGTTVTKKRLKDFFIRSTAALRRKPYLVCKFSEARCKLPLLLLLLQAFRCQKQKEQGKKPYAFFSLSLQSSFASLPMRSMSPFASFTSEEVKEAQSSLASDQPFRGIGTGTDNVANEGIELGIQTIQRTTEAAAEAGPGISSVVECTPAVVESSVSSCASIFSSFASCLGCLGC